MIHGKSICLKYLFEFKEKKQYPNVVFWSLIVYDVQQLHIYVMRFYLSITICDKQTDIICRVSSIFSIFF